MKIYNISLCKQILFQLSLCNKDKLINEYMNAFESSSFRAKQENNTIYVYRKSGYALSQLTLDFEEALYEKITNYNDAWSLLLRELQRVFEGR